MDILQKINDAAREISAIQNPVIKTTWYIKQYEKFLITNLNNLVEIGTISGYKLSKYGPKSETRFILTDRNKFVASIVGNLSGRTKFTIKMMIVHPKYQKKGLMKKILLHLIKSKFIISSGVLLTKAGLKTLFNVSRTKGCNTYISTSFSNLKDPVKNMDLETFSKLVFSANSKKIFLKG